MKYLFGNSWRVVAHIMSFLVVTSCRMCVQTFRRTFLLARYKIVCTSDGAQAWQRSCL